jgi:hypothetical protein
MFVINKELDHITVLIWIIIRIMSDPVSDPDPDADSDPPH